MFASWIQEHNIGKTRKENGAPFPVIIHFNHGMKNLSARRNLPIVIPDHLRTAAVIKDSERATRTIPKERQDGTSVLVRLCLTSVLVLISARRDLPIVIVYEVRADAVTRSLDERLDR